jgi:prepilin-type N-terminal cleavage/methylation domain-containing protein
MKLKKISNSSKGLTLIEVLLSLAILSIILLGSMKFFTQAYSYTSGSQNKTAAVNVARNALMFIENESFIEVRKRFLEDNLEGLSLYICNDSYITDWHGDESDFPAGCRKDKVTVNNIQFDVIIRKGKDYSKFSSSFIPLEAAVTWENQGRTEETIIEGAIKSEDLR